MVFRRKWTRLRQRSLQACAAERVARRGRQHLLMPGNTGLHGLETVFEIVYITRKGLISRTLRKWADTYSFPTTVFTDEPEDSYTHSNP